jgi:hypothetical protein
MVAHMKENPEIHWGGADLESEEDKRLLHFAVHAKTIHRPLKYGIQL